MRRIAPDPFTAPAHPAHLTHQDLLDIAAANRLYDAIEATNRRLESVLVRGIPGVVEITDSSFSEACC